MRMFCALVFVAPLAAALPLTVRAEEPPKVSYYKDVRPVFQQHCNGCHQPAKPLGGYVMTTHADLLKAGEREKVGVVPGKPAQSYLVEQIKVHSNGKAEMPKGRDPLGAAQIKLITDWIAQGAVDDTPASAKAAAVDASNPPKYSAPPVVTAVAFSPDGAQLAVTGYHEVLIYDTTELKLRSRLIGISERVQSLAFSPDGKKLAAVGGAPGRFGEVQVWRPGDEKLLLSAPVTFDTLYGVSWSPDGKTLAFGCADNTVRAIDAASGKQTLQMGTHSDWVLGTVFSQDGAHLISVGRDMSMKLTEVETQRFVDNVTSITPGALKGGLITVDRRPVKERRVTKVPQDEGGKFIEKVYDEVVVAGADGRPRLYKIHREVKRQIGDDANKIREYEPLPGRVSAVAFNSDGSKFAACSSLDGKGEVRVYDSTSGAKVVCEKVTGPVYTVAWQPDGKRIASAGFDGTVWLHDPATGKLVNSFVALPNK
ncbi:translocation protein TolB [Gemmata obscuriglobus]|nr:c-type cytochrome domain-containing protein [Gemmata obscuriglobus]QEG29208.1 translocation protein TolB [Gemmata obscuriglobus]VTS07993.1 vegetatible incompatibility protein het-e-1 : Vegetatible incompatibility protein OS=uncultured planctomycete GN=HGMM_F33C03C20 PE=4 SV=1: PSCyt1: WD40: WD40: WD40 [Gemmata obscuriglobus UQM 2246]